MRERVRESKRKRKREREKERERVRERERERENQKFHDLKIFITPPGWLFASHTPLSKKRKGTTNNY